MAENKTLNFADVKKKVGIHLETALKIKDFSITYAIHIGKVWKVNIEFKEKVGSLYMPTSALISMDDVTGEIKIFQKGRYWRY